MTVYLDTSVILRKLLGQSPALKGWGTWQVVYSSELLWLEAMRSFDRMRLEGVMTDKELSRSVKNLNHYRSCTHEVPLNSQVVYRAAQPFATVVRTLDALHLATALLIREQREFGLCFLTHDRQLAVAAQALGFEVQGAGL